MENEEVKHKLGFHAQKSEQVWRHALDNQAWLKVMDFALDETFLARIKERRPNTPIVARYFVDHQPLDLAHATAQGEAYARKYLTLPKNTFKYIDVCEMYNEPNNNPGGFNKPEMMDALNLANLAFRNVMIDNGKRCVFLNFSNGFPIEQSVEHFNDTFMLNEFIGCHGYGYPVPLAPDAIGLTLRYRMLREAMTKIGQVNDFLLNETGVSAQVIGGNDSGWTVTGMNALEYFNGLVALNAELMKDDYLKASFVYTLGATIGWFSHEIWPDVSKLIAYNDWTSPIPKPPPIGNDLYKQGYINGSKSELQKIIAYAQAELAKYQ